MNENILFVDDEPAILKALTRLFRRDNFTIYTANSGEEALARIFHKYFQTSPFNKQREPTSP